MTRILWGVLDGSLSAQNGKDELQFLPIDLNLEKILAQLIMVLISIMIYTKGNSSGV